MDLPVNESLERLEAKVRLVGELYRQLKMERERSETEIKELKNRIRHTEEKLKEVNNKYNTLKVAKSLLASSDNKHDAKIKVNRMVREIDKCIALLNR